MTAKATTKCGACEQDVFQVALTDHQPVPLITLEDQTVQGVRTRGDYLNRRGMGIAAKASASHQNGFFPVGPSQS